MQHTSARTRPRAPAFTLLASEPARAFMDLLGSYRAKRALPPGDGHPVIVYPGLGAGEWSTRRLRSALAAAGHDVRDWGRGQNTGRRGDVSTWLASLAADVSQAASAHGGPVSLVGWSLGGIFAREVARLVPHDVRQVVTLGSPFAAAPSETHAGWLYQMLNRSTPPTRAMRARMREPLPVPSTSIYSKADGVVAWRGCLQARSPLAENIEVEGVSHLGMGVSAAVLAIVADRLAQPAGASARHASRRPGAGSGAPHPSGFHEERA